jgi:hypothetical protein
VASSVPILHTIQPLHPGTPWWAIPLKGEGLVQSTLQHQNGPHSNTAPHRGFFRGAGFIDSPRQSLVRGWILVLGSWLRPCSPLRHFLLLCHAHQRHRIACGPRLQLPHHSHLPSTLSSCVSPAVACARGTMSSGWIPWRQRLPSRAAMEEAASTLRWRARPLAELPFEHTIFLLVAVVVDDVI